MICVFYCDFAQVDLPLFSRIISLVLGQYSTYPSVVNSSLEFIMNSWNKTAKPTTATPRIYYIRNMHGIAHLVFQVIMKTIYWKWPYWRPPHTCYTANVEVISICMLLYLLDVKLSFGQSCLLSSLQYGVVPSTQCTMHTFLLIAENFLKEKKC